MDTRGTLRMLLSHIEHMAEFIVAKKGGYSFESLGEDLPLARELLEKLPDGFEWINKPVTVTGEDFTYEATCLCSFPKTNGKVRYIVEDRGRLFIQRESQLQWPQDLVTVAVPDDMDSEAAGKPSVNSQEYLRAQSELKNRLVSLPGCPHCGYRHPPDGVCLK